MNNILDQILPETYKKGYFYNKLSDKDKIISFLRSVININYENCMNTIETNKRLNKFCYDEIKNLHNRGNVMIGNTKLYDLFEEGCFHRSHKNISEDCKHKGFFIIQNKKDFFYKYLENELNFSYETIMQIDNYIEPTNLKRIKKLVSSSIKNETTFVSDVMSDFMSDRSYINSFVKKPGLFYKEKTIPRVISSRNTTTRKHSPTHKVSDWKYEEDMLQTYHTIKQNRSSKIISKRLREHPQSILTYNLHKICSDSGYCIVFGKKTELIKKLFENFNNPSFIESISTLSSGGNGEVLEVLFERYKYKVYLILKRNLKRKLKRNIIDEIPDNLVYEYFVGKFLINKYYKKFPCFLETYGFIFNDKIKNIKTNKNIFNIDNIDIPEIKSLLEVGCTNEKDYFGVVIEYVKNPKTLLDKLVHNVFWYKDLLNVLFQVYYALCLMKNVFTHYDLHLKNVLLFEPKKNYYIQYNYHYNGEVISFKSKYLVKIIDYGRCGFINNEDHITSRNIYNELCSIQQCKEEDSKPCGAKKGFIVSSPDSITYITPRKLNVSHDLRLLKMVGSYFNRHFDEKLTYTKQFVRKDRENIYLLMNTVKFIQEFGTPENKISGLTGDFNTSSINNVMDAFITLKKLIQLPYVITQNDIFYNEKTKLGDLHIYDDGRDMVFNEI